MRLQYIGGGEKALEALRVQNRPALIFAGLLVHVLSVLRVYYDQLIKHRDPTVRNRGRPDPELCEQLRKQVQRRDGWQCQILWFQTPPRLVLCHTGSRVWAWISRRGGRDPAAGPSELLAELTQRVKKHLRRR
jgi:hypothetical protein